MHHVSSFSLSRHMCQTCVLLFQFILLVPQQKESKCYLNWIESWETCSSLHSPFLPMRRGLLLLLAQGPIQANYAYHLNSSKLHNSVFFWFIEIGWFGIRVMPPWWLWLVSSLNLIISKIHIFSSFIIKWQRHYREKSIIGIRRFPILGIHCACLWRKKIGTACGFFPKFNSLQVIFSILPPLQEDLTN